MTVYDRIKELCAKKGVTVRQMEIDNGMTRGKASKWKIYTPQSDTLLLLAEYFGVSTDYLLTGESDGIAKETYHSDPEIVELVNEVARIPEAKVFLSAIKDMPKEDLETISNLVKRMANNR